MDEAGLDRLTGAVYDATLDDRQWATLPARLSTLFGASFCALWSFDPRNGRPQTIYASDLPAEGERAYAEYYHSRDPWRANEGRAGWDEAVFGSALIADRAFEGTEYYAGFGRRHDSFHLLASRHVLSGRDQGIVSKVAISRPRGMTAFDATGAAILDRLIPHLRRALQMRHMVAEKTERAEQASWTAGLADMVHSLCCAVAVVDGHGRVVLANEAMCLPPVRRQVMSGRWETGGGIEALLQAEGRAERERLRRGVADAATGGAGDAFLLRGGSSEACRIMISPLRRNVKPERLALVMATPLAIDNDAAGIEQAVKLFGLSRGEARAVLALTGGAAPAEVADAQGVSITTVRTLLQRAQGKIGARDLRGLVAAATLLRK